MTKFGWDTGSSCAVVSTRTASRMPLSESGSSRSVPRHALLGPPFGEQLLPGAWIGLPRDRERGDAIGAEVADGLARLAPAHQHAHAIEEPERERPHRARGLDALEISIRDVELALSADRAPDLR